MKPYARAVDIVEASKSVLSAFFETSILENKNNKNLKILRVLSELNAQTRF
jgi:hypothetical protein